MKLVIIEMQHKIVETFSRYPMVSTFIWLWRGINNNSLEDYIIRTKSGNFLLQDANLKTISLKEEKVDENIIINDVIDINDVDEWGFYFDGDTNDAYDYSESYYDYSVQ